ncbi:MAG: SLBB domain-containing protein [Pyrinomonadaceae bacterium]
MKAVKFLPALCAVIFLNGLFINGIFGQNAENPKSAENKINDMHTAVADKNSNEQVQVKPPSDEKYRIGFQDTLEVSVFRHPELSLPAVNVSSDGTILMPKIDQPIVAVCKTEREMQDTVASYYKNYLRNPFVNVRVIEQRSQPFAVIGAVEKPGNFYLNRRIRLLELIAFAGGPKVEKAGAKIQVARVGNVAGCGGDSESTDDKVEFFSYKVKDVMTGNENPWMEPGDIVSVLEAEEAYVVGNVIKPAKISLKDPVTLTQAIAIGGGLTSTAKTNKVKIQRQEADSPLRTELVYDLKDIKDKKIADPVLQANDIVEVPNDNIKTVQKGVFKILTNGLSNVFFKLPTP